MTSAPFTTRIASQIAELRLTSSEIRKQKKRSGRKTKVAPVTVDLGLNIARARLIHNGKEIVTRHICPPIPIRTMDWCAYFDGEEEAGGYGYGRTEAEAVADFIANLDEE